MSLKRVKNNLVSHFSMNYLGFISYFAPSHLNLSCTFLFLITGPLEDGGELEIQLL